jgi:hypothetical protein
MQSLPQKSFPGAFLDPLHPRSVGLKAAWNLNTNAGSRAWNAGGTRYHGDIIGADWIAEGLNYNGSSDEISGLPPIVVSTPCTFLVWFRVPDFTDTDSRLISIGVDNVNSHLLCVYLSNDPSFRVQQYNGVSDADARVTGSPLTPNVWHRGAGVFYSDSRRAAFLDGVKYDEDTASQGAVAGLDYSAIGNIHFPGVSGNFGGQMASAMVYDRPLLDEEVWDDYVDTYAIFRSGFFNPAVIGSGGVVAGAIMNMFQRNNSGADLFNGTFM